MKDKTSAEFFMLITMLFFLLGISLINNFFRDRCFEKGGEYYSIKTGCVYRKEIRND